MNNRVPPVLTCTTFRHRQISPDMDPVDDEHVPVISLILNGMPLLANAFATLRTCGNRRLDD